MAKLSLRDALNTSLTRTKQYIDTELAKKANSSHGTHLTLGTGSGNAFRGDYGNTAYQHSQAAHAPSNAQKNSDITKAEIEAKLTGAITSHTHSYLPLAGGIMTGDVSYKFTGTGGHAIGLTWINNNTNNTKFGGIGALANAGTGSSLYIGWGSEPWVASNNLQISSSGIKYKNNKIYHAGDKPTPDDIGAAKASHGTHVSYGGNGSATTVSRSDHTHSYLPLSGGTISGNIYFADVTSTTYPAKSTTLTWNGSTDGADIYYQVDASDKGRLVLNTRDDADCIIAFANKGTIISTIDNSGNFSGKAATATKATQDSAGQQINTTYIKGLSVSGKTITYTKGDGTTGTITTQDTNTTYSAATQSAAGLMSAADKKKLDGVATSANNYSHPNSGATAGSYGPSANASPALGGTFSVPYFTINTAGHVTAASTKTITLPSDITTFTKSLKVTTSWMDVGISGTNLSTGTYAVQVFGDFAGQGNLWPEYFSGIMSWYSGGTDSTDADEISLHSCGHATSGNELYLRTLRQSRSSNSPVVKLQIATDIAFTAAVSITFKFKKLI